MSHTALSFSAKVLPAVSSETHAQTLGQSYSMCGTQDPSQIGVTPKFDHSAVFSALALCRPTCTRAAGFNCEWPWCHVIARIGRSWPVRRVQDRAYDSCRPIVFIRIIKDTLASRRQRQRMAYAASRNFVLVGASILLKLLTDMWGVRIAASLFENCMGDSCT